MGHYHRIVNLDRRQVIEPGDVGSLDKLLEFGHASGTAMAALWLLLGREAWCGDRIAILGYEGRPGDLAPEVVAETGVEHDSYYDDTFDNVGELARWVLVERGVSVVSSSTYEWGELWTARVAPDVTPAGVEVVAVDLDRRERLDPARFGDSRDLHLAAAGGGLGGVTTALTLLLAASNRGGSRGGGDFRSRHPAVGSWGGDHVGVVPVAMAEGFVDVSDEVRDILEVTGEGSYEVDDVGVRRGRPPWWDRATA